MEIAIISTGVRHHPSDFDGSLKRTVLWYRDHEDWWKAIKEKSRDFQAYYAKAYAGRK